MTFEMIDSDQWHAEGVAETLCAGNAHQQRADQTRSRGHRDFLDVAPRRLRILERAADQGKQMLQMFARGNFRNDAAERTVTLDLRGDEIHTHAAIALQQRDLRLVARCFDSENHGCSVSRLLGYLATKQPSNLATILYNPATNR